MTIKLPITMLICLISTIVIECSVSYFLKIKNKKDLLTVILVNVLTNPLVVSLTFYINISYGLFYRNIALLIMEILVVLIEGIIYSNYIVYSKTNPYLLSLILNFCSYFIGLGINYIIY